MKYLVFWLALAGTPFLGGMLALERKWIRWAFFGMVAGLCLYQPTAINFFSHEFYKGTSRGMEVSLIHLLALAVLLALAIRGKRTSLFPEGGIRIYVLYFLLCLPSLWNADNVLFGWLEVWKMLLLFLFWHAVYGYLSATGDVETVVKALAVFALANGLVVMKQHYTGWYQPAGVFPHRNGMAMGMNMIGPLFCAGYLQLGLGSRLGRLCALAFALAALSGMWAYSRGGVAVLPIGYGLVVVGSLLGAGRMQAERVLWRFLPVALGGILGLCAMWTHLVERFVYAPKASGNTRVDFAVCAGEMMKDHPWAGVGINNWGLNLASPHDYQERAALILDRPVDHTGIVETVYLLVGAECGIPALLAMLMWFGWHWVSCLRLERRLRGSLWHFVPVGLFGGLTANYLQSTLEWVLRQQMSLFLLMFCFATLAHFRAVQRGRTRLPRTLPAA